MNARAAAAALLLAAVACGTDAEQDAKPAEREVSLLRLAFEPGDLTVPAGTRVTWHNDEVIGHTVTSGTVTGIDPTTGLRSGQTADGRFDAPLATKGATFSHAFDTPGTYSYYCAIHLGMNARVVVT
ncbi:MAG TPA: plastocyanin/azurin family copper-binding protein [Frankiaceae bacterium]|nr:plastocyanin/azurin family copper-binding protein [Frankiaceae bacterium]